MSAKTIEDVIRETLTGDAQKNALDFIAYLRANEIEIPVNAPYNFFWDAEYRSEGTCIMNVEISDEGSSFDTFIQKLPDAWVDWPDDEQSYSYVNPPDGTLKC